MAKDIVKELLAYNEPGYNYLKLVEELAELQEVVIKRYLKKEENKPPLEKLVEEMGDVLLRMRVVATQEKIKDEVSQRVADKSSKLLGYIKEGKYKGGA
jgi:NTP pyrophosphatase (non-canonical NTP hydrolase)